MIPPIALSINRKLIAQVPTFNFFGIMLDSNMLWISHTNLVFMKLSKNYRYYENTPFRIKFTDRCAPANCLNMLEKVYLLI